jgi:superfamily II DNA or RNA helicase
LSQSYSDFVESKLQHAPPTGLASIPTLAEYLFPHQRDLVTWALRRGRCAIFADTGLGKTAIELEWARHVAAHTGGDVLILAPLAVAQQTVREGARFGVPVTLCRVVGDVRPGINVTNYERLHHFDPPAFAAVVLDESSIIKHHDAKSFRLLTEAFEDTAFRLCATATPAPNDWTELGTHAEFLGICSRAEMLAEFFCHDGGETQTWRLKGHARAAFWSWVASWGAVVRKPSDLGHDDGLYLLPSLDVSHHILPADDATVAKTGLLFAVEAQTLNDRRAARRGSLDARVAACADTVNASGEPWIVWCDLNAESEALTRAIDGAVEVRGSNTLEEKEARLEDFIMGRARVLVSKPSIAGFGLNLQHCSRMAFVGVTDSYEAYYQAIRRCWRFGQRHTVQVHVYASELEGAVVKNIERKERDAAVMAEALSSETRAFVASEVSGTIRDVNPYEPRADMIVPAWIGEGHAARVLDQEVSDEWAAYQGDAVDVLRGLPAESIDYSVFSPPFASLYTYSNSPRDIGNVKSHDEFAEHMGFLIEELYRATKPGRLVSFHCMDLPTSKERDGVIGLRDFRGLLIRAFECVGWIYHSSVVIWKDPVTAMQRTKALGLLWKQLKKDSAMSRQGIPDYVVTMRKPGVNDSPIAHSAEEFTVEQWQRWASPVWTDINPSDTLQYQSVREHDDERHICPLQLEVIRRCVYLWSNPGDVVLSPFAGIGSEGVVSVQNGRRFVGIELKRSYYEQSVRNLRSAMKQTSLFAADA